MRWLVRMWRLFWLNVAQAELDDWLDPKWGPLTDEHYRWYEELSEKIDDAKRKMRTR